MASTMMMMMVKEGKKEMEGNQRSGAEVSIMWRGGGSVQSKEGRGGDTQPAQPSPARGAGEREGGADRVGGTRELLAARSCGIPPPPIITQERTTNAKPLHRGMLSCIHPTSTHALVTSTLIMVAMSAIVDGMVDGLHSARADTKRRGRLEEYRRIGTGDSPPMPSPTI
jgi:hypothetical protein